MKNIGHLAFDLDPLLFLMHKQVTSEGNLSTLSYNSHHPSVPETDHYEIPSTAALFKEFEDTGNPAGGGANSLELETVIHRGGSRGLIQTAEEKCAQKQKNLYQMLQMLSTRLATLDGIGK